VTALILHADGASRGNPGDAAGGAIVTRSDTGQIVAEVGVMCGVATNNVAEYRGMIAGVQAAKKVHSDATIDIRLDSKLVVEQMSGRWKVKHPDMRQLVSHAWDVIGDTPVTFTWIPREENATADALANRALDTGADFETLH
jgi:probable phosphoglycerate mutase